MAVIKIKYSANNAATAAIPATGGAILGELAYSYTNNALVISSSTANTNLVLGGSAMWDGFNSIGKTGTGFNVLASGATLSSPVISVITGVGNISAVENSGTQAVPSLLIKPGTGQWDKVKIVGALEVTGSIQFSTGAITVSYGATFGSVASFSYAEGITFNAAPNSNPVLAAYLIKPSTAVVASISTIYIPYLNTTTPDTFATLAATQTFTNKTLTTPAISQISTNSGSATITLPIATGTLATLAGSEAFSNKTISASSLSGDITISTATTKFLTNSPIFPVAGVRVYGVVDSFYGDIKYPALTASVTTTLPSHSIIFASTAAVTLTLPANNLTFTTSAVTVLALPSSGTVVTKDSTDTLTNKTFNTAAAGNAFQINGTGITAVTGTGAAVLATSPTITTPTIAEIRGTGGTAALALYGNVSTDAAAVITLRSGSGTPTVTVHNTGLTAAGTLAVTGAATFASTLSVTTVSLTSLAGALTVTGAATLNGGIVIGSGGVGGTITTATSVGTIIIKPSSDATLGTLTLTANATVGGTLGVTGIATFTAVPVCTTAPTTDTQLANKLYVDSVAQGLHVHPPVRVATTANLTVTSYTWVTGTGTLTISALTVLDGVTLAVNDRILVKDQTVPAYNGIYYYSSSTVLLRSLDANYIADLSGGDFVFVKEGTTFADCGFVQNSQNTTEFHTTTGPNITFVQFSQAGVVSGGAGLTKNGTTLDVVGVANSITVNADSIEVAATYAGGGSITTLGTVTTGTIDGGIF